MAGGSPRRGRRPARCPAGRAPDSNGGEVAHPPLPAWWEKQHGSHLPHAPTERLSRAGVTRPARAPAPTRPFRGGRRRGLCAPHRDGRVARRPCSRLRSRARPSPALSQATCTRRRGARRCWPRISASRRAPRPDCRAAQAARGLRRGGEDGDAASTGASLKCHVPKKLCTVRGSVPVRRAWSLRGGGGSAKSSAAIMAWRALFLVCFCAHRDRG